MKYRLVLFILLLLAGACATPTTPQVETADSGFINDSTLGPGDLFDVRVYGEKDLSGTYRVASDGTMDFPLIGTVYIDGFTPSQVKKLLEKKFIEGELLREPQISVLVKEFASKKISVLGEVNKPGTFIYHDGMGVVEAISLASGFTPMARRDHTTVTRIVDDNKQNFVIPVKEIGQGDAKDFELRPGDIVFVPERVF